MLPDGVGAPAHCAALTARCLQRALKSESPIRHSPPWYGPSTLLIELSTQRSYRNEMSECDHHTACTVDTLLHGSAAAIEGLKADDQKYALMHLANKCMWESETGDAVSTKLAQKQLAMGLLRALYK